MRAPTFLLALVFSLALAVQARADSPGQALAAGDSARAARALTASLTEALSRSNARLYAAEIGTLQTALARDLSPIAALSRNRPRVEAEIEWRENAAPPRRGGACGGFVDAGRARVTGTSTARSSRAGMTQLACALTTQEGDEYGWTGVWLATTGEGALFVRMRVASENAAVRNAASRSLQRALQRIGRSVRPLNRPSPQRQPPPETTI